MKRILLSLFLFLSSCEHYSNKRKIEKALQEEYQSSQEVQAAYPELEEVFRQFSR